MLLQITEEQSVNGAFMLCTSGVETSLRVAHWLKNKKEKVNNKEMQEICSMYRGGEVSAQSPEDILKLKKEINNFGGNTNRQFFFHGNRGDLAYFWKIEDGKNVILPKAELGTLSPELKKNVIRELTVAEHEGLLYSDDKAYALTEKGKNVIYSPEFAARRIEADEKFFKRAEAELKAREIPGIKDIKVDDNLFVFESGRTADSYAVVGGTVDIEGKAWLSLSSADKGDLMLPAEAVDKIAFSNPTQGRDFLDKNPAEVEKWREFISEQRAMQEKELSKEAAPIVEEYTRNIEEIDGAYLVSVGENNYEKLELPKDAVEKLEDGSIKATIFTDKDYNLHSGDAIHTVDGNGAKELLKSGVNVKISKKATVNTAKAVANAAVNTVDGAATALPPAKAVTAAIKVIYKAAEAASQVAQSASQVVKL